MENIICNELVRRGWEVDVGVVETWARDKNGKSFRKQLEIDFVCNRGSRRCYVQSAFMVPDREKMAQEQRSFSAVADSFQRIMVVKEQGSPWQNEEGTLVIGLKDFLLRPELTEPAAISPASPTTAIDRNAALFDEVAPDLGSAFGSSAIMTKLSKIGKAAK